MASKRKYTVNYPSGLNVRAKPSVDSAVVRVLQFGEKVAPVTGEAPEGWVAVKGGFCLKKYLD